MSQINAGAVLVYTCQTQDTITLQASQVIQQVTQALQLEGIIVESSSTALPGMLSQIENSIAGLTNVQPFTANLTVQTDPNGTAYGSQDDVKSIIDSAFWNVTGSPVQSSSIPTIQSNPGGTQGATGAATSAAPPNSDSGESFGDSIADFFNNLDTGTTFAIVAVIVVAVVILALVISPGSAAGVVHSFRS